MPTVTKRDGSQEPLDLEKLHKVIQWAAEGLQDVDSQAILQQANLSFYEGIKTSEIQQTVIQAAANLISKEAPNYQFAAARLAVYDLRKRVYGSYKPWSLLDIIKQNVSKGLYTSELLEFYSQEEWEELDSALDHSRDECLAYAAISQFREKYLVKLEGVPHETPQVAYILCAATLFSKYPKETRLSVVKRYYEHISTHKISLPTPINAGVRTRQKQFASCVLINCGDSLDSISRTTEAIIKYVSAKAGIGLNGGRIRAEGSSIRGGTAFTTGILPFWRLMESAVNSCSQGAIRPGAATLYYPIWHLQVEEALVLKNNKGNPEKRIRKLDYGVQLNGLFYRRLLNNGVITLFSPHDVPELYKAFFVSLEEFTRLYEEAEANPKLRKKSVQALDLFSLLIKERKNEGRIYIMNVDHVNSHGAFIPELAPIEQSNLCCEIGLHTKPL
jgi:ribonucleoside-diphosphate reductase alpha chain